MAYKQNSQGRHALILGSLTILTLLCLSPLLIYGPSASSAQNYSEKFDSVSATYLATSSPTLNQVLYSVSDSTYRGAAANVTVMTNITDYSYTSVTAPSNVSANISISSSYMQSSNELDVNVSGNAGTLLYIGVEEGIQTQLIWTGAVDLAQSSSLAARGIAYVNASEQARIVAGFASARSILQEFANLNSSVSLSVSLPPIKLTANSSSTSTTRVNVTMPARYQPLEMSGATVNASASVNAIVFSAGVSAFGNATLPSLTWSGSSTTNSSFRGNGLSCNLLATATEFYGVNGDTVGYAQLIALSGNESKALLGTSTTLTMQSSSTQIVSSPQSVSQVNGSTGTSTVLVGGQSVVVQVNASGYIGSTATIVESHKVNITGQASVYVLLLLNTSKSESYVLINPSTNSSAAIVEQTSASTTSNVTITVNSTSYQATKYQINASGYAIFNVTSPYSSVIVFKQSSSGSIEALSTSDYWTQSGKLYIFNDPAATYYAVPESYSSSSSSSTTGTLVSQTTFTTASSATSSSQTSSGMATLELAAAIVIIIAIVAALGLIVRRQRRTTT